MALKTRLKKLEIVKNDKPPVKIIIIRKEDDYNTVKEYKDKGYRVIQIVRRSNLEKWDK